MFKHILVPTDGSPLSLRAAKNAVRFAKGHGARITAFYAAPEYHPNIAGDYMPANFVPLAEFKKQVQKAADKYLDQVKKFNKDSEAYLAAKGMEDLRFQTAMSMIKSFFDSAKQWAQMLR